MTANKSMPDIFRLQPPTEEQREAGVVAVPACTLCGERLLGMKLGDSTNKHRAQQLLHWTGDTHRGC
jgi:hypothetical protein